MKLLTESQMVGAGGFIGSILRFGINGLVHRWIPYPTFPYGTLAANVVGRFAIGLLGGIAEMRDVVAPGLRLFLFVGLLCGFTTFSTFGFETLTLARNAAHVGALANVVLHVLAGLGAVLLGLMLARGS